jgi:hypothetical protein
MNVSTSDEDRRADAEVEVRGEVDVLAAVRPASFVISVRTPSSGVIRKLTPKPAATPANAAAIPASGFRPTLLNARPPSGISTRYPASEAMLEMTRAAR